MLYPPIAQAVGAFPGLLVLLILWLAAAIVVAAAAVSVLGPRSPGALILPTFAGLLASLLGSDLTNSLAFLLAGAAVAAVIQRLWIGAVGPSVPALEGMPWGHQPAALLVARRRALRRAREGAAPQDPAAD